MPHSPEQKKLYRLRPEVRQREKERLARQYQANKEAIDARRKERYRLNKEVELARNKLWSERNKERHRHLCRQWSKTNPLAARALVARRRAIKAKAEGSYTKKDIQILFDQQISRCKACHCDISQGYEVDHIIPLIKGGSNWPSNIQLLCMPCNRSKSSKTLEEWGKYQLKQVS
jgi:5-methylcytosine-specific restriction endonuclease McrA